MSSTIGPEPELNRRAGVETGEGQLTGDEADAVIIAYEIGDLWRGIPGASQSIKVEARGK